MRHRSAAVFAAVLALAAAPPAEAARYRFSGLLTTGALAGQQIEGEFALKPLRPGAGDVFFEFEGPGALIDFDLTLGRTHYGLADARALNLYFADGVLIDFFIGGAASGFDYLTLDRGKPDFILGAETLAYVTDGPASFGMARRVSFAQVPAAGSVGLALFGLGLVAAARGWRRG